MSLSVVLPCASSCQLVCHLSWEEIRGLGWRTTQVGGHLIVSPFLAVYCSFTFARRRRHSSAAVLVKSRAMTKPHS